jgi:hypothetical protein
MLQTKPYFSRAEVEQISQERYQAGLNVGYMYAIGEELLELEAMKRELEKEVSQNGQL